MSASSVGIEFRRGSKRCGGAASSPVVKSAAHRYPPDSGGLRTQGRGIPLICLWLLASKASQSKAVGCLLPAN